MILTLVRKRCSVDLTVSPPRTENCTVLVNQGEQQGDHCRYRNNAQLVLEFDVGHLPQQVELRVRGLVSRLNPNEGYSPITVLANGKPAVINYTMPGQGYQPHVAAFHIPGTLLQDGKNQFALQVSGEAKSFFWLYGVELLLNDPFACNLTANPPVVTAGLTLTRSAGQFENDHLRCDRGDGITLSLHMPKPQTDNAGLVLDIYGLVSRLGPERGYSPVDVIVNGKVIASRVEISPDGYDPQVGEFFAPAEILKDGENTVGLRVCDDVRSVFWLYKFSLIAVGYGS